MNNFFVSTKLFQFDSGGPVLWENPTTGRLVHVGIISYGIACGTKLPSVNTRVGAFVNWIVSVTPGNENDILKNTHLRAIFPPFSGPHEIRYQIETLQDKIKDTKARL